MSEGAQCQTLFLVSRPIRAMISFLEIIRKSRVASQARVDAARQVGDTVGPTEAEHGSQFMQRDLAGGEGSVSDFVFGFSADPGHDLLP